VALSTADTRAGIIGGVIGAVVVVLGIAGFLFWRRRRQQNGSNRTPTQLEPQSFSLTESKPDAPVEGNSASLSKSNHELKGDGGLPITEEAPLPALPQDASAQLQQSQPLLQAYTQAFPQQHQYPQPSLHFAQMNQTYPQQQMYQNYSQPHPNFLFSAQPIPSPVSPQSFNIPTQSYYQHPSPPTSTITSSPSAQNARPAEQLQQDLQLSNHPRPSFTTTVGRDDP
jgi:hypothetical protein